MLVKKENDSSMAQFSALAPTTAQWQSLYNLYWTLAVSAGVITVGALVYFALRYRTKPQAQRTVDERQTGIRLVLIVVFIMAVALGGAAFASFQAIAFYDRPPNDPNAVHITVIGSRFQWSFQYSDGREVPGRLVVPANTVIILNITSVDVFHSFGIAALRIKSDAIPGKSNMAWFSSPATTTPIRIQCYELCGNGHAFMQAKLTVCQGACV